MNRRIRPRVNYSVLRKGHRHPNEKREEGLLRGLPADDRRELEDWLDGLEAELQYGPHVHGYGFGEDDR